MRLLTIFVGRITLKTNTALGFSLHRLVGKTRSRPNSFGLALLTNLEKLKNAGVVLKNVNENENDDNDKTPELKNKKKKNKKKKRKFTVEQHNMRICEYG